MFKGDIMTDLDKKTEEEILATVEKYQKETREKAVKNRPSLSFKKD